MTATWLDHLFGLLLVLALPLLGSCQYRRMKARLAAGAAAVRVRQYRSIIVEELVLAGVVLAMWLALGRSLSSLAPGAPSAIGWTWVGWGAALGGSAFLVAQTVVLLRGGEALAEARKQLANVSPFLPRSERELRTFWVLSLAAGVCEEIVFRGFAMTWLAAVVSALPGLGPIPELWPAAVGSSVIFGLAHAYQGPSGMARTGTVGLVLAGIAVATGGLLAAMIVHTVMDVTSGLVAHRALAGGPRRPEPVAP